MLVGRVIARPYVIENGERVRTSDRHDYAVPPYDKTLLDNIVDARQKVIAIGKISDIFSGRGISNSIHTESNEDGVEKTIEAMAGDEDGLIFTNLVDFDSKYGHRRDAVGYGRALERFDESLPRIISALRENELLILCADHGTDPDHTGTDHTREYIPCVIYGKNLAGGKEISTGNCFADIGATIAAGLGVTKPIFGTDHLSELL
jgi:phosphopentomutase